MILVDGHQIKTSQLRALPGLVKEDVVAYADESAVSVTMAGAHRLDIMDESVELILVAKCCTAPRDDQQTDD
jgi:hypothetical protein